MEEIQQFRQRVEKHLLDHILTFWSDTAVDFQEGGWMAWLSNDLIPDRGKPKGLIVHSRILWAFSAAYRVYPRETFRAMAERAYRYLTDFYWDDHDGGAFWQLDDRGAVIDDSKKIYGQAFLIYSLSEFHLAFGEQKALEMAKHTFQLIENFAHDSVHHGYLEVCQRDWAEASADARLSDKDLAEKKSMNNHLHILEACTNLHRVWPDRLVKERLRELIELFLTKILDRQTMHFHHFFDERWLVRSDTCTYGHDIEGSWLLCEAAEALGDKSFLHEVEQVAVQMAAKVRKEAWASGGGIYYEGREGRVIDRGRECWPQAEAVVGFFNAYQLSNDERYLQDARSVWNFIESSIADHEHGEWFWRIKEDGTPDSQLPKVSEWKGPYHGTRACLEIIRRIDGLTGII